MRASISPAAQEATMASQRSSNPGRSWGQMALCQLGRDAPSDLIVLVSATYASFNLARGARSDNGFPAVEQPRQILGADGALPTRARRAFRSDSARQRHVCELQSRPRRKKRQWLPSGRATPADLGGRWRSANSGETRLQI